MRRLFSRERFGQTADARGTPAAGFRGRVRVAARAHSAPNLESDEECGPCARRLEQWHGHGIAGTPAMQTERLARMGWTAEQRIRSRPFAVVVLDRRGSSGVLRVAPVSGFGLWLTHSPYVLFGVLLGASVWYVSRRLYGNAGGYIALALYCFSPAVVRSSALWVAPPDIAGAWGTFGAVFTAIAVSHTLYAPREVVLWNWRRIVLAGNFAGAGGGIAVFAGADDSRACGLSCCTWLRHEEQRPWSFCRRRSSPVWQ